MLWHRKLFIIAKLTVDCAAPELAATHLVQFGIREQLMIVRLLMMDWGTVCCGSRLEQLLPCRCQGLGRPTVIWGRSHNRLLQVFFCFQPGNRYGGGSN